MKMIVQSAPVSLTPYQAKLTSPIGATEPSLPQDTFVKSSQEVWPPLMPRCQPKAESHLAAKMIGFFGMALGTATIPLTCISALAVGTLVEHGIQSSFTVPYSILAGGVACGLASAVAQVYLQAKGDPLF